jgi:hypothetical protein
MTTIAADIDRHHAEAIACAASAVEHAKAAGTLLLQVKAQLPHGEFVPWMQAHLAVSKRQAQRYMTAAMGKPAPARIAAKPAPADAPETVKSDTVSLLATVPQAEAPKVAPTDLEDDDRASAGELLEELQADNEALQVQIKALTVTDIAAELAKQIAIRQGIEARLSDQMTKCHALQKDLDSYGKFFAELRKVTGQQTRAGVLDAYRRMAA